MPTRTLPQAIARRQFLATASAGLAISLAGCHSNSAGAGLSLDVLVGPDRLSAVAQLAKALPSLRIIIDHVANVRIDGSAPPATWVQGMRVYRYASA